MNRDRSCTCADQYREESLKFFLLASVVAEEGGATHTINRCKQCNNDRRLIQGGADT